MDCSLAHVHTMLVRLVSWSLSAKCFMKEYTPLDLAPAISLEAIAPESRESSEKYSKVRPENAERWMFMAGAYQPATCMS